MATRAELLDALKKADAAGDTAAARAIARRLDSMSRGSTPAPSPAPTRQQRRRERTWGDTFGNLGRRALEGAGDLANMAFGALAPTNPVLNVVSQVLPYNVRQQLAERAANEAADRMKLDTGEGASGAERVAGAMTRGAVGSLIPGGAGAGIVRNIATNVGMGALASGAGQTVKEAGGGPVAQTAAALATGIAVPTAASTLRHGIASAPVLRRARGVDPGRRAHDLIREAATDPVAARNSINRPFIADKPSHLNPVSGARPTLAEVASDPGLAAFQRSNMDTPIQTQMRENTIARANAANRVMDEGDPQAMQTAATVRGMEGESALEAAQERVGPQTNRVTQGRLERTGFENDYSAAKSRSQAAYAVPEIQNPTPAPIPKTIFRDLRNWRRERYGDGGGVPNAAVTRINQEIRRRVRQGNMTSRTVGNLDKRLADAAGEARLRIGRDNAESAYAEGVRAILQRHADEVLPEATVEAHRNARAVRLDQGQRFEQSAAGDIFGTGDYGRVVTPDTEIPSALTARGPAGGTIADAMVAARGPNATEAAVRQELRRIIDEGKFQLNPEKAHGFEELLQRFPGLRKDINTLRQQSAANAKFEASQFGKLANPDVAPTPRVSRLLDAKDEGRSFTAFAEDVLRTGDTDAISGLRRSLAEYVEAKGVSGSEYGLSGRIPGNKATMDAIDTVLSRADKVLTTEQRGVLTTEQRGVLSAIRREMENVEVTRKTGVAPDRDVPLGTLPLPEAQQRIMLRWLTHFNNDKAVNALISEAIRDPKIAARLLERPTIDRVARIKRRLRYSTIPAATGSQQFQQEP